LYLPSPSLSKGGTSGFRAPGNHSVIHFSKVHTVSFLTFFSDNHITEEVIRKVLSIVAIFAVAVTVSAQYQVKSLFLKNPKKCVDYIVDQADFYVKAKDDANGGFYSYVDRQGNPVYPDEADPGSYGWYWNWKVKDPNSWPQWVQPYNEFSHHLKGVAAHSRVAYAFLRAFQISGDEKYIALAEHALDFMYAHGWDYQYGGWLFTTDEFGNMAPWLPGVWWDPNYFKWTYEQAYPLVGIAAMVEVTGGTRSVVPFPGMSASNEKEWLLNGFEVFNSHMWDSRPDYLGYYMNSSNVYWDGVMWQNPNGKSFTGVVDVITTHASPLHMLFPSNVLFRDRFNEMGNEAATRLVTSIGSVPWGMATDYDSDWNPIDGGGVSIGHMLKTAWVSARAYLATGNTEYRDAAKTLITYIYNNGGYDMVNGAPFANVSWARDAEGNATVTIGTGKGHWETEQGVTAGLLNYAIATSKADKQLFLKFADESLDFGFHDYMPDWRYGKWRRNHGIPDSPSVNGWRGETDVHVTPETFAGSGLLRLLEDPAYHGRPDIFASYSGNQFGSYSQRMVRDREWKYVWNATARDELYDLRSDPGELHNRAADPACAMLLRDKRQRLVGWMDRVKDPLCNSWTRPALLEGRMAAQ